MKSYIISLVLCVSISISPVILNQPGCSSEDVKVISLRAATAGAPALIATFGISDSIKLRLNQGIAGIGSCVDVYADNPTASNGKKLRQCVGGLLGQGIFDNLGDAKTQARIDAILAIITGALNIPRHPQTTGAGAEALQTDYQEGRLKLKQSDIDELERLLDPAQPTEK